MTLAKLLQERLLSHGPHMRFTELGSDYSEGASIGGAELASRARGFAAWLQANTAQTTPVVISIPNSIEFLVAFYGAIFANRPAVPMPSLNLVKVKSGRHPVTSLMKQEPEVVIISSPVAARLLEGSGEFPRAWQFVDSRVAEADSWEERWIAPSSTLSSTAYLQFTSGSTSAPRGVCITHRNILANLRVAATASRCGPTDRIVGWAPFYHDLGLITFVFMPVWSGASCWFMTPTQFLRAPSSWMASISRLRGTHTAGPNFAYEQCAHATDGHQAAMLDLSGLRCAGNGGERVRADTLDRFCEVFSVSGFQRSAFLPTYGMAESTLFVSAEKEPQRPPRELWLDHAALGDGVVKQLPADSPGASRHVSCGRPGAEHEVVVVHTESRVRARAGELGEIWIRGDSVAAGYWRQDALTREVFSATTAEGDGPWLRSGDLGFLEDGRLYVTGRAKELIIIHGRNIYPQDIEHSIVEAHPAVRPGCVVAVGVEERRQERLALAAEVTPSLVDDLKSVRVAILRAVATEHALGVSLLVLCPPNTLPKTTSGKLQRFAVRSALLTGTLEALASFTEDTKDTSPQTASALEDWLRAWVADAADRAPGDIDIDMPLVGYGLDSLQAAALADALGQKVGQTLSPAMTFKHPTIRELAAALPSTTPAEPFTAAPPQTQTPQPTQPPSVAVRQLLMLDAAFATMLVAVAGPALLVAVNIGRLLHAVLGWSSVVLWPVLYLVFLAGLVVSTFAVRLLLPRPEPGIHALSSDQTFAWGLNFALQRVVGLPLWKPAIQSIATLRYGLLTALGADVAFAMRTSSDASMLDAYLLRIHRDTMLGGGTTVSAHLMTGDRLHLAPVEIQQGAELWAGAEVALGTVVGTGSTIGVRAVVHPHVRIGPRCVVGNFSHVGEGVQMGAGCQLGAHCRIGAGAVLEDGLVLAEATVIPPGSRVSVRTG